MLQSFTVTNHRSFREEQELVLVPTYDKSRPVTTVAGIFGPNAAGKSNLLDALRFMGSVARGSYRLREPGVGIARHPFRLAPSGTEAASTFQIDVVLDQVRYVYGISVDDDRIMEEWLYYWPAGRQRRIFERSGGDVRLGSTLRDYRSRQARLRDETRENASVLSTAAYLNNDDVRPVYDWFRRGVRWSTVPPGGLSRGFPSRSPTGRMLADEQGRARLVSLLRAADTGIDDIGLVEMPSRGSQAAEEDLAHVRAMLEGDLSDEERSKLERQAAALEQHIQEAEERFEVVCWHGGTAFALTDESAGTRAWLGILIRVLQGLDGGDLLVVDEIDSSLHPRLTTQLIRLFQDPEINPNVAQLVFTSHDAILLGSMGGQEVLRRDEVWFIDKDRDGASTLYPLTDFRPRKEGEDLMKRYLGGSYGAVPNVFESDIREALGLDPWEGFEDAPSTR